MRINLTDFTSMTEVSHEVPDEPVRAFLQFLCSANRLKVSENPDLVFDKAMKLRSKIVEHALRTGPVKPEPAPQPDDVPEGYERLTLVVPRGDVDDLRAMYRLRAVESR